MADIELDNPLRRKQTGSDSSTYYIAYASVLLRPNTPIPAQFYEEFPSTVTTGVAADNSKLNIYAEEIVFLTGSSYAFPATHFTINCRSFTFCDAGPGPVTFDLSGVASTGQKTDGTLPLNASPATYKLIDNTKQWEWDWLGQYNAPSNLSDETPASQGEKGGSGSEGMPGTPGGSFTLTCDVNCTDADIGKYSMLVNTHGGAGFPGGNGSKGSKGGNAATIISPRSLLSDVSTGFSYTYDLDSDPEHPLGTRKLTPNSGQLKADVFHYQLELGHQNDLYLQSPMTTRHSQITGYYSKAEMEKNPELISEVDLEHCTTVEFRIMIQHRSKPMRKVPIG